MEEIDIVITCMGRLAHLKQSLPLALAQERVNCIVVDYSCPDRSGEWVKEYAPQAQVVRIDGQKYFNLSTARNAGANAGKAPWIFFLDADTLIDPGFIGFVRPSLITENFISLSPYYRNAQFALGDCIVSRGDFEEIGGYDDTYQGWGGEDTDLTVRLEFKGLQHIRISSPLLREIKHNECLRTTHYATKNRTKNALINALYSNIKWGLQRLLSSSTDKHQRLHVHYAKPYGKQALDAQRIHSSFQEKQQLQRFYQKSRQSVEKALISGKEDVFIPLSHARYENLKIRQNLHFHLDTRSEHQQPGTASSLPDFATALETIRKRWPKLGGSSSEEPLFLLAAGFRSGSTLLQRMLMQERCMWGEPYGYSGLIENLSLTFRCLTEDWPKDSFLENHPRFDNAPDRTWIANHYPDPQHLVDATLQYLQTLFATPARGKGYKQWGIKEVVLSADLALFLKWLYPHSRLIFLIRNPYYAFRSYRRLNAHWYTRWPDNPLASPEQFGAHWLNLAQGFLTKAEELGAMVLRYEEIQSPDYDWAAVEQYIGHAVNREALKYRISGNASKALVSDPDSMTQEMYRLSNVVNTFASSIGYWLPTPDELME